METNKVPTTTSTTVSATSTAINPLFDPVALQRAYFAAAQLHSQLQQNSHLTTTANTTAVSTSITATTTNNIHAALHKTTTQSPPLSACLSSFVDNDRLYSLLPSQLQSCLKQQERNFLQQQQQQSVNTSLAHHFSAFSPINTDLSGSAVTSTTSLFTQPSSLPSIPPVPPVASSQQPLNLLLMQMQMATAAAAAAAGFFPAAFNVLPPVTAAALGLLTPQFRMLQFADPNFSTYTASANGSSTFTGDTINKSAGDTSTIEKSLLQAQINLLANGSSLSSIAKEHTCTSNTVSDILPNGIASSLAQQLNPESNHNSSSHHNNNGIKQQSIHIKRSYGEMSILRSLCNENHIIEQETEVIRGKRSKLDITDERGQRNLQKSMKAYNSEKNQRQQQYLVELNNKDLSDKDSKISKENKEKCVASDLFDENSPDRHHPLNHRPPAMEARFLECMAAIALHSNIALPTKDENMIRNTSADGNRSEENNINGKSYKHKQFEEIELENSNRIELGNISSPNRSKSCENISVTTITSNENENKKCWPNSAIDEELCKELENYKDSDVPVIHAFVLPAKLSDSASSPISDKKYSQDIPCTVVPESLAVPVPILNTLLDRILQTMLDS